MDIKFLTNIDLNGNQLNNAVLLNLTTNPTTGNVPGRVFYNPNLKRIMNYTANGYKYLLNVDDLSTMNGDIGDLSDRIDSLESTLLTITGTDTDDVINKWDEIVAFINGTEGTTLDGILASYVTIGTDQTITGTKTFSNGVIFNERIGSDGSWFITSEGDADFMDVDVATINGYTPLTIGNAKFTQSLTSGTKIGEIRLGDTYTTIYAPTPTTVVNNLTSTSTTNALSAAQGKVLSDKIDNCVTLTGNLNISGNKTFTDEILVNGGIIGYNDQNIDVWDITVDGEAYFAKLNIATALSVDDGGTGATSAAAARANLGLGTAATRGVTTTVSSDNTDLVTSGAVYAALSTLDTSSVISETFTKNDLTADGSSGYTYTLSRTNAETVAAGVMLYDSDHNLVYTAISTGSGGTMLRFTTSAYNAMSGTWAVRYSI